MFFKQELRFVWRTFGFVLSEELANSGDQVSFRHVTAVSAQESLNNSDSLPLVVALMAEEDVRSAVSGLTRVDWTTGEPREDPTGAIMRREPVIDEVKEVTAEPASGEPSGATGGSEEGEPASGSGKKLTVKKMPKRPAAKLMPRKKLLKVKSETASGTRQVVPGKNLFKNRETKRRQKEKWVKIQKSAKEERAMPSTGGTGLVKSFFDPVSGRRDTVEITPIGEEGGHRFRGMVQVFPGIPLRIALAINAVRKGT